MCTDILYSNHIFVKLIFKKDICEINQVVLNFCRNVYRLDIFSKLQPELLPSLGVRRPLTFHILIFSSETPPQSNELKLGRKHL
jgi:hypothetical protein